MNVCKIVEDLLPLYVEELTSPETSEFVREHLAVCESCSQIHRRMTEPVSQSQMPENYKKSLRKGRWSWTWRVLVALVLAVSLPLYFFWEIGAFGARTVLRSEVSGAEFVVVDNSGAGLFRRGGAYVITPDGRGRDLKGDTTFQELEIRWAPDGETYFAWWKFDDRSESYFWGDTSVMEPDESGSVRYSYEDRKWPAEWDFLDRMEAFVRNHDDLREIEVGPMVFSFDMWSLDSERIYFTFTTEKGYGGRVAFDRVSREFTLQKAYLTQRVERRIPVEFMDRLTEQAETAPPAE